MRYATAFVEQLIRDRASNYNMSVEIEWHRQADIGQNFVRVKSESGECEIVLSDVIVDDLPGHVRVQDGALVPRPSGDEFLGDVRRAINKEVDTLAKQSGKRIGF